MVGIEQSVCRNIESGKIDTGLALRRGYDVAVLRAGTGHAHVVELHAFHLCHPALTLGCVAIKKAY